MKNYIMFLVLPILASCALFGPEYSKPNIDVSSKWYSSDPGTNINSETNLPDLAWWKKYDDPVLNQLIADSLQNNNQVQIALANLETSKGQLKQIEYNWIPTITSLDGNTQFPNFGNLGYFVSLFPAYTINIFQQINQQKQAKYLVEASNYAKDGARLTVIGQVASSYFNLSAQTKQLILYQNLLEDMQEQLKLYNSQFNSGIISMSQIDNTQSLIKQVEAQIDIVRHNIIVSENSLKFLANKNPGHIDLVKSFTDLDSSKIIPSSLPLTVLNNRPDLHQAEMQLKASNANIGIAYSQLLPTITLGALYFSATRTGVAPVGQSVGQAYASIPILNAQAFGQIAASNASFKSAYYAYVQTLRGILRDVDTDLSANYQYTQQLSNTISSMDSLVADCNLVNSRYKNGIDSYLQVVNCKVRVDNLAIVINQNKLAKFLTIVALYQDLAGGYNVSNLAESAMPIN